MRIVEWVDPYTNEPLEQTEKNYSGFTCHAFRE